MALNDGEMKPMYFECKPFWIIDVTSCSQGRELRDPIAQCFLSTESVPLQLRLWLDREALGHVESRQAHCYMFTGAGQGSAFRQMLLVPVWPAVDVPPWQSSKAIQVHSQELAKSLCMHINKNHMQCYTSFHLYSSRVCHVCNGSVSLSWNSSHTATLDFRNQELNPGAPASWSSNKTLIGFF